MSMGFVLLLVCVAATIALWWALAVCLHLRVRPTAWRGSGRRGSGRHRPRGDHVRAASVPSAEEPALVLDAQMTLEWADPAQVWPALNAENALLAARMAGQITPVEYRARVADLARRCEPHSAADSE
ncbi:hypothetical protein [Nocardia transvalensis]|uniref:hypothetical protein n=1 Tax=Nocardia transvalensis TaxID=37333 RepID=UPI001893F876|nr:hypothetical protein [Nocardia transvalensis]MBF6328408.1 hypothetical protein [Nocardia transvalensis]